MALSSLKLLVLGAVARVLRRWLDSVTARISAAPASVPSSSPNTDEGVDPRQPAPPEHWLELVRQHAPQLLDANESNDSTVFDYRAQDVVDNALADDTFQVTTRTPKALPTSVVTPHPRAAVPVPTVKTAPRRPIRLGSIRTQPVDADTVYEYSAQTDADALEIPTSQASVREALELLTRRADESPSQPLPTRESRDLPDEPAIAQHFADLPLERHVREIRAGVPADVDVPTVRTSAGKAVRVNQQRTSVPKAPEQTVLRPTMLSTQINIEDVTPERWASLPEVPAETPLDARDAYARRARLKREQEGRAWNG
jgi:hypothetical protein